MNEYLGVEDTGAFVMVFITNSLNIYALVDRNRLILSDVLHLNHSSIVLTGEGAKIIAQLAENSRYMRDKLVEMGLIVSCNRVVVFNNFNFKITNVKEFDSMLT